MRYRQTQRFTDNNASGFSLNTSFELDVVKYRDLLLSMKITGLGSPNQNPGSAPDRILQICGQSKFYSHLAPSPRYKHGEPHWGRLVTYVVYEFSPITPSWHEDMSCKWPISSRTGSISIRQTPERTSSNRVAYFASRRGSISHEGE